MALSVATKANMIAGKYSILQLFPCLTASLSSLDLCFVRYPPFCCLKRSILFKAKVCGSECDCIWWAFQRFRVNCVSMPKTHAFVVIDNSYYFNLGVCENFPFCKAFHEQNTFVNTISLKTLTSVIFRLIDWGYGTIIISFVYISYADIYVLWVNIRSYCEFYSLTINSITSS